MKQISINATEKIERFPVYVRRIGGALLLLFALNASAEDKFGNPFEKENCNTVAKESKFSKPLASSSEEDNGGASLRGGLDPPGGNNQENKTGALGDAFYIVTGGVFIYGLYLFGKKRNAVRIANER
jgi:hypothetical protein